MKERGSCKRAALLLKKGKRNLEVSEERVLLVELLTDLHHAVNSTEGCRASKPY
jgi:hypothetical protein